MVEKQGMKWQLILGALLLVLLTAGLFMPVFKITGDRYIAMAVDVNTYAEKEDLAAAKKAGTKKITDNYQKNAIKRKEKAKEFDKKIKKKSNSISAIRYIKWAFSSEKIDIPGIKYGDKKDINKSGVRTLFRIMGVLLLVPVVMGICNLVFMLVRRKTYPIWLGVTGITSIICNLIFWKGMPGIIWGKISPYVKSFTMISEKTLLIKGTGKYTMQSMMSEFMSVSVYVGVISGGLLVVAAVLFLTVCKPVSVKAEMQEEGFAYGEWNTDGEISDLKTQWEDLKGSSPLSQNGRAGNNENVVTNMKLKGKIYGIQGEYKDCEIEIAEGEEIVLGRDPKYCELIFSNKQVSRKHCGIRYDGEKRSYQVIDYSTNGTALGDGIMAKAGVYTTIPSGTVLYLAGGEERIQLGKRRYGDAPGSNMRR